MKQTGIKTNYPWRTNSLTRLWSSMGWAILVGLNLSPLTATAQLAPGETGRVPFSLDTVYPEHHPVVSPDGKTLYFSRSNHPANFGLENRDDIWVSYWQNTAWTQPVNAGLPLNDEQDNCPLAMPLEGAVLFTGIRNQLAAPLRVERYGRSWLPANRPFVMLPDSLGHIRACQISADERAIFFVAGPPGRGDIYFMLRQSGNRWSAPVHLPATINTPGDESDVWVAADGETLYFSSNGLGGQGGYDLFMTQRLGDSWNTWSTPLNLGAAINSPADEHTPSLPVGGEWLAFSSGTPAAIYLAWLPSTARPKKILRIEGQVQDGLTAGPVAAPWNYFSFPQGNPVNPNPLGSRTDASGQFRLLLSAGNPAAAYALREGFFAPSVLVTATEPWPDAQDSEENFVDELVRRNPDYRQRELQIQALQAADKQRRQMQVEITQAKDESHQQLEDAVREVLATPFPLPENPAMGQLRERYQRERSLYLPIDTQMPGAEIGPMTNGSRLGTATAEPLGSTPDLETFTQQLKNYIQQLLLGDILGELEKQSVPVVLQQLASSNATDPVLISWSNRLQTALGAGEYTSALAGDTMLTRMEPIWPLSADWQQPYAMALLGQLRPQVEETLRRQLEEPVRRVVNSDLRLRLTQERRAVLRREMSGLIQQQIQVERANANRKAAPITSDPAVSMDTVTVWNDRPITLLVRLFPFRYPDPIALPALLFRQNTAILLPAAEVEFNRLLDCLNQNSRLTLELGVQTSGNCSYSFAQDLTSLRVATLQQYAAAQGADLSRISFRSYGRTDPLNAVDTNSPENGQRITATFRLR